MELLAYETWPEETGGLDRRMHPGERLILVTYWRVREPANAPLKLFVHVLDQGGDYMAGEDRLDVWFDNWQTGDVFAQVHELTLPADTMPGRYQLELGAYDPETMQRLLVERAGATIADRVLLAPVQVQ
jgi:hypothetical protein